MVLQLYAWALATFLSRCGPFIYVQVHLKEAWHFVQNVFVTYIIFELCYTVIKKISFSVELFLLFVLRENVLLSKTMQFLPIFTGVFYLLKFSSQRMTGNVTPPLSCLNNHFFWSGVSRKAFENMFHWRTWCEPLNLLLHDFLQCVSTMKSENCMHYQECPDVL